MNLVVNKKSPYYISVMLDTENYRQRRRETLESLAFNLAKKAVFLISSILLCLLFKFLFEILLQDSLLQNTENVADRPVFLREIFLTMGLIVKIKAEMKDKHLFVELTGDDMGIQ